MSRALPIIQLPENFVVANWGDRGYRRNGLACLRAASQAASRFLNYQR